MQIVVPIAFIAMMFASILWMEAIFTRGFQAPPEEFAKHRDELRVSDTNINFGKEVFQTGQRDIVAVVGTLQNDGDLAWQDIVLTVAFFDKENRMVDAIQNMGQLSVSARGTASFKVSAERHFPKDQYVSYKVQVALARHARWRWPF
jgi:hypothetical protein